MNLNIKDLCGPHLLNFELCDKIEYEIRSNIRQGELNFILSFEGVEAISPSFAEVLMTFLLRTQKMEQVPDITLADLLPRLQGVLEKGRDSSLGFG